MKGTLIKTDGSETPIEFDPLQWWIDIGKLIGAETIETFPIINTDLRVFCDENAYANTPLPPINDKATDLYFQLCGGHTNHKVLGDIVIADFEELESYFANDGRDSNALV